MKYAKKILEDITAINTTQFARHGFENFMGITYKDYIFNKAYINIYETNTLFDVQALNHEVMHGIDFYIHPKVPSKNYFGFHEIPTYTIDYLFLNFLEKIDFPIEQIAILRQEKQNYLSWLANWTLFQIKSRLIQRKGLKTSINPNILDIQEVMTPRILKQLLEIESGIIAYGLSSQIEKDKEKGLKNLLKLLNNDIPKEKRPDFSFINLSDDNLLQLSKDYYNLVIDAPSSVIKIK